MNRNTHDEPENATPTMDDLHGDSTVRFAADVAEGWIEFYAKNPELTAPMDDDEADQLWVAEMERRDAARLAGVNPDTM